MEIIIPVIVLGAMGLFFGSGLALASKIFEVQQDERIPLVRNELPGANCGGCGYPGCDALAEAIVKGEAEPNACPVGGQNTAESVAEIMGIVVEETEPQTARVLCHGTHDLAPVRAQYYGVNDCREALNANGGTKSCRYGCLGFGSCVAACPFDAIVMTESGIPQIDEDKCTACATCVAVCPKSVIGIVPKNKKITVSCQNLDKAKLVKPSCQVGCVGCRLCTRVCPTGAITVTNNLASIDYDKCISCGLCIEKCPSHAITGEKIEGALEKYMQEHPDFDPTPQKPTRKPTKAA